MVPKVQPWHVVLAFALVSGSACDTAGRGEVSDRHGDASRPQVVQEGDRRLLRIPAAALASPRQVPAPTRVRWVASGADALQSLGFTLAAAELPDGRVAVLDGMSDEVHVLSREGKVVARWGGRGEGPEQFQAVSAMFVVSDSLIVVDHGGARASHVRPDGSVERLLSTAQGPGSGTSLVGRLSSGEWIGARSRERLASAEGVVDTLVASVVVLDANGAPVDSLGEYVERLAVLRSTPQMRTMVKLPYSPRGGARTAGTWVAFHTGLDFGVTLVDRSTGQSRVIQFDTVPARLATEGRAQIVEAALEQVVAQQQSMVEQLWQRVPWPEHQGGLVGVHPTIDGGVWIGVVDAPAAAVGGGTGRESWRYVDPRGTPGRAWSLGAREQLLAITDSSAIVLARDEDGVQSIRWLELSPTPPGTP